MTGARLEFRLAPLVTLEVSGGYLRVGSEFAQSWNNVGFTYTLDVDRSLSGGFVDLGTSMRWAFGDRIGLVGRFAVGGFLANVTNRNTGFAKRKTGPRGNLLVERGHSIRYCPTNLVDEPTATKELTSSTISAKVGALARGSS